MAVGMAVFASHQDFSCSRQRARFCSFPCESVSVKQNYPRSYCWSTGGYLYGGSCSGSRDF